MIVNKVYCYHYCYCFIDKTNKLTPSDGVLRTYFYAWGSFKRHPWLKRVDCFIVWGFVLFKTGLSCICHEFWIFPFPKTIFWYNLFKCNVCESNTEGSHRLYFSEKIVSFKTFQNQQCVIVMRNKERQKTIFPFVFEERIPLLL